mmetsp:Transcript_25363/g.76171  ORF Transcript_25363/g.76171 Transcript_25363/m.76171 type:complete len:437 (+) Transcript_25363:241-1551(+)
MVCSLLIFTHLIGLCRAAVRTAQAGPPVISEPGCKKLQALIPAECPDVTPLVNCADVLGGHGELCEGDGECGTDKGLDNCIDSSNPTKADGTPNRGADVYRIVVDKPEEPEEPEEPEAPPAEGQKVVVCIGDSITVGEHGGDIDGDPELESAPPTYPAHLQADLDLADPGHFRVVNLGRSGATAMSGTDRPFRGEAQFDELQATKFDYAFVMLGTNDAKTDFWDGEKYASDYKALLAEIQAMQPNAKLALGIPPAYLCGLKDCEEAWKQVSGKKCCAKTTWGGKSEEHINYELTALIRQIADDMGLETIEWNLDFAEYDGGAIKHVFPQLYTDPIHPNELGYVRIAFDATRRVLSWEGKDVPVELAAAEAAAREATAPGPKPVETLWAWAPALMLYALPLSLVLIFITCKRPKGPTTPGARSEETLPLKYLPPEMS